MTSPTANPFVQQQQQPSQDLIYRPAGAGSNPQELLFRNHRQAAAGTPPPGIREGQCAWPDCGQRFDSPEMFACHLNTVHDANEHSFAQYRIQAMITEQVKRLYLHNAAITEFMCNHLQARSAANPSYQHQQQHEQQQHLTQNSNNNHNHINSTMSIATLNALMALTEQNSQANSDFINLLSVASGPLANQNQQDPQQQQQQQQQQQLSPPQFTAAATTNTTNTTSTNNNNSNSDNAQPRPTEHEQDDAADPARSSNPPPSDENNNSYAINLVPSDLSDANKRKIYMSINKKPPFTYAALIRQAIMESNEQRLALNEIYRWFEHNFHFFRQNTETWKNAIRHNLSLHECFKRISREKNSKWVVDDDIFHKRGSKKKVGRRSAPRSFEQVNYTTTAAAAPTMAPLPISNDTTNNNTNNNNNYVATPAVVAPSTPTTITNASANFLQNVASAAGLPGTNNNNNLHRHQPPLIPNSADFLNENIKLAFDRVSTAFSSREFGLDQSPMAASGEALNLSMQNNSGNHQLPAARQPPTHQSTIDTFLSALRNCSQFAMINNNVTHNRSSAMLTSAATEQVGNLNVSQSLNESSGDQEHRTIKRQCSSPSEIPRPTPPQ